MRKLVGYLLVLLTISSIISFEPTMVRAESKTIVVPDDFPTISLAIANASNGDNIFVKNGTYREKLTINKSISIIGENAQATTIILQSKMHKSEPSPEYRLVSEYYHPAYWYDEALTVKVDNFKLMGFTITTIGGDGSIIGDNIEISGNSFSVPLTVSGANNRLSQNTFSEDITIRGSNNQVIDNVFLSISSFNPSQGNIAGDKTNFTLNHINSANIGFTGQYSILSFNEFIGTHFSSVSNESYFYYNYFNRSGLMVTGNNNIVCRNSIDHYLRGLILVGYGNKAMLNNITYCKQGISPSPDSVMYANYIAYNENPIYAWDSVLNPNGNRNYLIYNNFVDNLNYSIRTLLARTAIDYFDNGSIGNYWNSYNGSDRDGDGIGDSPFYLDERHLDRHPLINPCNLSAVEELVPDWLIMPTIQPIYPESVSYSVRNVSVDFVLNKPVSWMGYSLDGIDNETIAGNFTLTDLPFGAHNITLYVIDGYGNQGNSQINFTIENPVPPIQALPVISIIIVSVFVCIIGLILYRRRVMERRTKSL
jgi:hypothetical protein